MSLFHFTSIFVSVITLASANFCYANPINFASEQPPVSREIYDGTGGKFLIYTYGGAVRLQHIDETGNVWSASKLLIQAPHPMALYEFDETGNVWILTYDLNQDSNGGTVSVQCFDRWGKNNFQKEYITLPLSGVPQMHPADGYSGMTITTEQQTFRIDTDGAVSLIEQAPTLATPEPIALVPVPVSYGYEEGQESLVPFQFSQDQNTLEITTYLGPEALKEVVIRLENESGTAVFEFSGLIGNDYYNWIIPTQQLAAGIYYLSMRLGEREQVEQIRI